jgi:DNA-binding beta-propeller fold protein YncE
VFLNSENFLKSGKFFRPGNSEFLPNRLIPLPDNIFFMSRYSNRVNYLFYIVCLSVIISCTGNAHPGEKTTSAATAASIGGKTLVFKTGIKLPHVKGGFDLMAVDIKGRRLFVSAADNHTLEVIDLKAAKPLKSIPGFNEPKWVVYRPESNRLYVSTGGDGKVTVLDGTTYKAIKLFSFREKCNNLRYDTAAKLLYVGVGDSFGSIGVIDVTSDKITGEIQLSDFPKQFELDGNLMYVNIPSKNCIDVVDLTAKKVIESWQITASRENVPMALDRIHKRLFIACEPGKFIVYATGNRKAIASLDISKNADGIYYDAKRNCIYVSCGEGAIMVIQQKDADHYAVIDMIPTAKGAGTSLYSPQLDQLFLAVPQIKYSSAELQVYEPASAYTR